MQATHYNKVLKILCISVTSAEGLFKRSCGITSSTLTPFPGKQCQRGNDCHIKLIIGDICNFEQEEEKCNENNS